MHFQKAICHTYLFGNQKIIKTVSYTHLDVYKRQFNEGSGKVVIDRTGNGNDITASKDPIWVPVELPQIY